MSSGKSKRIAASRWTTALVLAGMLVLGFGLTAMAQSSDESSHGLEGTWREQLTVRDCDHPETVVRPTFPTIFAYAKGGTLTVTTSGQLPSVSTTGLGVWNHISGRTYSAVSEFFIFSPTGAPTQIHRLTRHIEVSRDAKRYTDAIALEILDINFNQIGIGCATAVATRME